MAVLHATGRLGVDQPFTSESILGSNFVGRIASATRVGEYQGVVPTISGRSWIYGQGRLGRHPDDPFPTGYTLSDTWPTESARSRVTKGDA
jgi:proline racemase